MFVVTSLLYNSYFAKNDLPHLPLLYKYHAFYNILYFISSIEIQFSIDVIYKGTLQIVPNFHNIYKYITGTLNRGQPLSIG